MEKIIRQYPAGAPATRRALTGVVASGDLEVLLEPGTAGMTTVTINTSVDGKGHLWHAVLSRLFGGTDLPAAAIEINDSGATPGVVRLRIEQAFEQAYEQATEQASTEARPS